MEYVSVKEAAEIADVSVQYIYSLINQNKVKFKISGTTRMVGIKKVNGVRELAK